MSTLLNFGRDVQGLNAYAPQFPVDLYSVTLPSDTGSQFNIPTNSQRFIAVFSYQPGAVIWVCINGISEPPMSGTFTTTNSELMPAQLLLNAGDEISCYNNSTTSQDVGVVLYAIP